MAAPQKLDESRLAETLRGLAGWQRDGESLARTFTFKDFTQAMAFANRVADAANAANHHPDIHVEGYNKVRLVLSTHSAGGITQFDVELARKISALV